MDDDATLLRRHIDGDRDAFGELVLRHRDRLWAVALRTLGDREEAADALQDALLSAFRAAGSYRGDAQVTTWLHRIVVNACIDRTRRRASRPTTVLDERTAAAVPDPRDDTATVDLRRELLSALAALPVEQAAALVLVDVEGHSVQEAAAMLEVPIGTVKSRCARGRTRLAVSLGHLRPERNPTAPQPVQPHEAAAEPVGEGEQRPPEQTVAGEEAQAP
jgi:RNA polymerase sigma-70 factor (ECF subfamily)